jgi:hypothetical protein
VLLSFLKNKILRGTLQFRGINLLLTAKDRMSPGKAFILIEYEILDTFPAL